MNESNVSFSWREPGVFTRFDTAVCLHGHTMHSEESLSFLPECFRRIPGIAHVVDSYQRGPVPAVDFARAFWTPPLTPASALRLEREQIARLSLRPIVSLTDHDNIEAGMSLQVAADAREAPVSVEWTVPYRRSIIHLGVHNLPPGTARTWLADMAMYTLSGEEELLPGMLEGLGSIPGVLIVLNHPFWLEAGVHQADHLPALQHLLRKCHGRLHAFELNGTRRWQENRDVIALADEWSKPVISGGDRHGCEPAACLNVTNARGFSEFADEVRAGSSRVVFMPQYREPMPLRVLEAAWDVLRPYPEHPDRKHWTDRIFYRGDDGTARRLSAIWNGRAPWVTRPVTGMLQLFANPGIRVALRYLLSWQTEIRQ